MNLLSLEHFSLVHQNKGRNNEFKNSQENFCFRFNTYGLLRLLRQKSETDNL